MKTILREIGDKGEEAACRYLRSKGYHIIERNFSCKLGEIDIIAYTPLFDMIVFAEVKTRKNFNYGFPYEFVDRKKMRRIILTSESYVKMHGLNYYQRRFDIVEILNMDGNTYVRHLENVVDIDR